MSFDFSFLIASAASFLASATPSLMLVTAAASHASAPVVKMWSLVAARRCIVDGGNGEPCAAIAADKRVMAVMERRCIVTEAKKGTGKEGKRSMSSTKKGGKKGKRKERGRKQRTRSSCWSLRHRYLYLSKSFVHPKQTAISVG